MWWKEINTKSLIKCCISCTNNTTLLLLLLLLLLFKLVILEVLVISFLYVSPWFCMIILHCLICIVKFGLTINKRLNLCGSCLNFTFKQTLIGDALVAHSWMKTTNCTALMQLHGHPHISFFFVTNKLAWLGQFIQ